MRWEDERYVRVYTRDTAEWLALGWEAQALLVLLLRKADRAGIIQTGKAGVRGIAALAGMPLDVVQRALPVLLEDGCLRASDGGGYVFPNFLAAQEARSSDAQRKREQRARDRDKAVAGGARGSVTGLDIEAQMSRADGQDAGHASHPGVTSWRHTVSRNVTDVTESVTPSRAVPCLAEPSPTESAAVAASPEADGLRDATDDAQPVDERPALELTAQPMPGAEKKPRKPSAGELLYARLEDRRQKACEAKGRPFIPSGWSHSRMNRDLGPIARAETANPEAWKRFQGAWLEFITDEAPGRAAEPWPLDWFWAQRARYEAKALAEAEQAEDAA